MKTEIHATIKAVPEIELHGCRGCFLDADKCTATIVELVEAGLVDCKYGYIYKVVIDEK